MQVKRAYIPIVPARPMFDTLAAFPLSSDLFAQTVHPSEPLVAVGLSSGHVATLKLPSADENTGATRPTRHGSRRKDEHGHGTGTIETAWRTKRHHGSCRCLAYNLQGTQLYSAGTDGIVKAADTETGKVTGKVAIPPPPSATRGVDAPTVIHALSPTTLLLTTDSGALHLYDLRNPVPSLPVTGSKMAFVAAAPAQTHHPHSDYISSLSAIPPSSTSTSGFSKQWLTTGGTTLALTDLRRGVLVKSEDQEEILLSSVYVTGLPAKKSSGSTGEKALVGGGDGVITLWEKGQWDDQDERITVSREKETLDCLALVPEGIGGFGSKVAVGLGDGQIRFVRIGQNKVIGGVQHDEIEGVTEVGFDVAGRMISGGGQVVKVWTENIEGDLDEDENEDEDEYPERESDPKRGAESDEDDAEDSSESEEKPRKRRKKRKRGKGPARTNDLNFSGLD